MKKKIIAKESIGRDLIGASNYASRSSVVHNILLKYPDPNSLAKALSQMANDSKDARVKAKCLELAQKCQGVDIQQYPGFVKKVAGLSKLWSVAAKTVGAAAAASGTYYLIKTMAQAASTDDFKNAEGVGNKASALFNKTGESISKDVGSIKSGIDDNLNKIKQWGIDRATDISKKADELSGAKAERAAETAARKEEDMYASMDRNLISREAKAANDATNRKLGDEIGARTAADKELDSRISNEAGERVASDAELGSKIGAETARATGAEAKLHKADIDAAEHTRRKFNAVNTRLGVGPNEKPTIKDSLPTKEDIKDSYKETYGPTIKKAKEMSDAATKKIADVYDATKDTISGWANRIRSVPSYGSTSGMAWDYRRK